MFIISGRPPQSNRADLEVEEEEFNDLAVFDFTDSYRNLTVKRLVSFHFALGVFKTSFFFNVDDMYVNFRAVFHLLSGYREGQGVMAGYCPTGVSVTRNRRSKWFVSEDNFPEPAFPQFCFGFAYIISRSAMEGVVGSNEAGVKLPPLDDVAVGILAAKHGNITLQHHKWIQRELLPGQLHHARTQTSTNLQHVELLLGQTADS